ncbi:MAG: UbiD family decarboxylase [Candidatus Lustribacter sp.]|jgi:UbiD family decarboxylase
MISAERSPAGVDTERFRLRNFVESLGPDELERHDEPLTLAAVAAILEGNPRAVLFTNAGPDGQALTGNVLGSRARMARAFGVPPEKLLAEIMRRLRNKPEFVELTSAQAPVHEVILTGKDADVTKLPVHLQHGRDGGPYISAALDISIDAATGWRNVGLRRCMVRGPHETGIDLVAVSDLKNIYKAAVARGERLPLSIVVGSHPIDYFAGTMRIPVDELGLMSQLRDAPLPVVKSVTNDIPVPADAEYVIEGYLGSEGYIEAEGPFGEFLGYYGGVKINPVFHVTAITHRRDALFQTLSISGKTLSRTDTAQLTTLRTEALVWRALENAIREPVAVYAPPATGGVYNVRCAIRQRNPGEARNAMSAVFACMANVKNVFIVDPDIDVFSDEQMEWAFATRLQPNHDVYVEENYRVSPLDPSLPEGIRVGSKSGYDMTLPFGGDRGFELSLPEVPAYTGPRFPSVRAALEDGPKYFEALMVAIGTADGRDVVRMLDELRQEGVLGRETAEGRYHLK